MIIGHDRRNRARCAICRAEYRSGELRRVYIPEVTEYDAIDKLLALEAKLAEALAVQNALNEEVSRERALSASLQVNLQVEKDANRSLRAQMESSCNGIPLSSGKVAIKRDHTICTTQDTEPIAIQNQPRSAPIYTQRSRSTASRSTFTSPSPHIDEDCYAAESAFSISAITHHWKATNTPPISSSVLWRSPNAEPSRRPLQTISNSSKKERPRAPVALDLRDKPCYPGMNHRWSMKGTNGSQRRYTCEHCSLKTAEREEGGKWVNIWCNL